MKKHRGTATHCNTLQHTATHCNTLQQSEGEEKQEEEGGKQEEEEGGAEADVIEPPSTYGGLEVLEIKVLQYTATHCNTLQQTLQHTLQHTAHCNTLGVGAF